MKVVDICEFYAPQGGGVRTYVHAKLAASARLGCETVIVAPGPCDEVIAHPGGRIVYVKAPHLPFDRRYHMFWDSAAVHALLDRERPDVLEASSPWRGAWVAASWRGEAVRSLFMHLDPLSAFAYRWFDQVASREAIDRGFEWFWNYLRRLNGQFDTTVCASASLATRLEAGGVHGTHVVPMGIDAGIFSPAARDPALRAELLARCQLPEDATLLIGIGRHTPEKRWPTVIDAVQSVAARRPVGLVLIGDGHQRHKVLGHIEGNPHIQPLMPVRDRALLARIMASADAMIHGSGAETFGLAAAEAQASGLPLILPDCGAAVDLADPAYAEVYKVGDAASAAAAIERVLDRGPATLRAASARAAARPRTLDDHFTDLYAFYADRRPRKAAA